MTAGRGRRSRTAARGVAAATVAAAALTAGAVTAGASPAAAATPAPAVPSTAQLKAALLAPADMGSAFTLQPTAPPPSGSGTASTVTGCPQLQFLLTVGSSPSATNQGVTYQAGEAGPTVGESLSTAPPQTLASTYADNRSALTSCKQLTVKADELNLTLKLTPMSLGGGPQAAAARMDGTLQGVQINGYLAIDDVGRAEMTYLFLQVGGSTSQVAAHYYQVADAKARQLDTLS